MILTLIELFPVFYSATVGLHRLQRRDAAQKRSVSARHRSVDKKAGLLGPKNREISLQDAKTYTRFESRRI